jgi:hypothetical protein
MLNIKVLQKKSVVLSPKKHHKSTRLAPQKSHPGTSKGTTTAPHKHQYGTIKMRLSENLVKFSWRNKLLVNSGDNPNNGKKIIR